MPRRDNDNPANILLVAIPFLLGGILLLLKSEPCTVIAYPARHAPGLFIETASVSMEHAAGAFALLMAAAIVWLYFRIRNG